MKVLVTGGAGYIGSHMVLSLLDQNHEPVVIDNLSNGSKFLLPRNVDFHEVDVRDEIRVEEILNKYNFDTVVHFAADIVVPESIKTPDKYIENNTLCRTQQLLKYFGEEKIYNCGKCDVCIERNKIELSEIELKKIIN